MSDDLDSQDLLGLDDEDEELMSNFDDLFSEDDDIAKASSADAASEDLSSDDGLDDLDAFLDDFEKNLDVPDVDVADNTQAGDDIDELVIDAPAADDEIALDEVALPDQPDIEAVDDLDDEILSLGGEEGEVLDLDADADESLDLGAMASEELQIDDDMLDLDTSGAPDEAVTRSEEIPVIERAVEPESAPPTDVLATAATAAAVAATAARSDAAPAPMMMAPPASGLSRTQVVAGGLLLTISLALSAGALWLVWGLSTQVEVLNQNVTEIQQRIVSQSRRGTISPQVQWNDQLNRLAQRVNELAVIVEGPVGHMRESYQQSMDDMNQRLALLEKGGAPVEPVQIAPAPSTKVTKPLVSKAKPVAVPKQKGGWVINLLSVGSAKAANEEVARLKKLGINADKQQVSKEGRSWYRLQVTGFSSYDEAKSAIAQVEKKSGFESAWVGRQ